MVAAATGAGAKVAAGGSSQPLQKQAQQQQIEALQWCTSGTLKFAVAVHKMAKNRKRRK